MNKRSEHIRKELEKLVESNAQFDFADVAQIVADSGQRTQGMDKSEIYYEASESLACLEDEELRDDWGEEFVPTQSVESARKEDLEDDIVRAYNGLRESGMSPKEINRLLYLRCEHK